MGEIERYQPREVERADRPTGTPVDSWVEVWRPVVALAEHVHGTEFVPKALRGNAPAVAASMLYGRELGMGPLRALQVVHVVEGRPTLAAEQMRAMVYQAGHELEYRETTRARCIVAGRRRGQTGWTVVEWTMQDARDMQLAGKRNWRLMPRQMLTARATAELCRLVFADVIGGLLASEEVADGLLGEPAPAESTPDAAPARRTVRRATRVRKDAAPTSRTDTAAPATPPTGDDQPPLPDEIEAAGNADTDTSSEPDGAPAESSGPRTATDDQLRRLHSILTTHGIDDRDERLRIACAVVGRDLGSSRDLTHQEAGALIDFLHTVETQHGDHFADALDALLSETEAAAGEAGQMALGQASDDDTIGTTDSREASE